jgi:hypothetical protein
MAQDQKQFIPLEYLNRNDHSGRLETARLRLETRKSHNGGLYSGANVEFCRDGMVTFELCGDFSIKILHNRAARATQKAIDTQHAQVFTAEAIAGLQDQVKAYYEAKAAE